MLPPAPPNKIKKNHPPSRILGWYGPWFLRGAQIWLFFFNDSVIALADYSDDEKDIIITDDDIKDSQTKITDNLEETDSLPDTLRGKSGFGSTGRWKAN